MTQTELFAAPKDDTSARATSALTAATSALIEKVLTNHPLVVAWSGGKDSSCTLILALDALQNMARKGPLPTWSRIAVLHNDTGVENPVVSALAKTQLEDLARWCEEQGLPVDIHIGRPSLAQSYMVNILGGGQMPTWPESRRRVCTHKLKIDPARRTEKTIDAAWKKLGVTSKKVTLTGTRLDESARRARNIASRGEQHGTLTEHEGRLTLAPIVDWSVTEVFNLLSDAGTSGPGPRVWRENFFDTIALYEEATGECPITAESLSRSTACGARFGCSVCCAVETDSSMKTLTSHPRYAFMRPLLEIRDFMMAIRYDWSRRNWLTRQIEPGTDGRPWTVKIQPDHFDSQTLLLITAHFITADHEEALRAQHFDKAMDAGAPPANDPWVAMRRTAGKLPSEKWLQTMRRPQFQHFDARTLVALDFYAAANGKYPRPFTIMELHRRITKTSWRPKPLSKAKVGAPDMRTGVPPIPPPRILQFGMPEKQGPLPGMHDPLSSWIAAEGCGTKEDIHPTTAGYPLFARESESFDVDEEGAELFVSMMYDDCYRERHFDPDCGPLETIWTYLNLGIVSLSPQGRRSLDKVIVRRQALAAAGLDRLDVNELISRSTPTERADDEHDRQDCFTF